MRRRGGSKARTQRKKTRRSGGDPTIGAGSSLKIGKRGVYLISHDGETQSFRLVDWEQITKTLGK